MGVSRRSYGSLSKHLLSLGLAGALVGLGLYACTPDEHRRSSVTAVAAGHCTAAPGQFPAPDCSTSDDKCTPTPGCTINEAHCGPKSTCLNFAQNSGSTLNFRLRRLNVIAPPALTYAVNSVLQTVIVNDSVSLADKSCAERGKGTFSWLLQIDKTKKTMTTGGAPPPVDAFGQGYCFFDRVVTSGEGAGAQMLHVQPVTVPATETNGTYVSSPIPKLLVPIFLDSTPTPAVIVLPLSATILKDMTVSSDGNCIGGFNESALDPDCFDDYSTCSKWKTAGSLAGFITLEEADHVFIRELNTTLCVVLAQSAPDKQCKRDSANKILAKGDYCSNPAAPGGCQDSYWLAATFAASAVKINDGATTPACQGGTAPMVDAGQDAPPDAPPDAGAVDASDASDSGGAG